MGARRPGADGKVAALAGAATAFEFDCALVDTAYDLIGTVNRLLAEGGLPPLAPTEAQPSSGRYQGHIADESQHFPG